MGGANRQKHERFSVRFQSRFFDFTLESLTLGILNLYNFYLGLFL